MTDIWSPQKRSEVMSRIRKTDSSSERVLRLYLKQAKINHSTYGSLPGTPDIIIKSSKLAVFVHGCFWHGCPHHYRPPHSNAEYWSAKLRRNKARDKAIARKVRAMGWRTAVVWECQAKNPQRVVAHLQKRLETASGTPKGIP